MNVNGLKQNYNLIIDDIQHQNDIILLQDIRITKEGDIKGWENSYNGRIYYNKNGEGQHISASTAILVSNRIQGSIKEITHKIIEQGRSQILNINFSTAKLTIINLYAKTHQANRMALNKMLNVFE